MKFVFWVLIGWQALGSSFPKVDADLQEYDEHVFLLRKNFSQIPANLHDKE